MRFALKALSLVFICWPAVSAAACITTNYPASGPFLTAALVNPAGDVSGDVDGGGCDIVIYYAAGGHGQVNGANVHNATHYGILNNGAHVQVQDSTVYDIGDVPAFTGVQHGIAIFFGPGSDGDIRDNTIWNYQKGGIVVRGPHSQSSVQSNTVIGQGPIGYIAQNGIEIGLGADGDAQRNTVVGNSYTGAAPNASAGILLYGGAGYGGATQTGSSVQQNIAVGNDVGVWFFNVDAAGNPVTTPTRDQAQNNTVRNNGVNNRAYQAGISDTGDDDQIQGNSICGAGYTPLATPPPNLFAIDVTFTNNATVAKNTVCNASAPVTRTGASGILLRIVPSISQ